MANDVGPAMLLIISVTLSFVAEAEYPRRACAPLLWPATTSLKSSINYPLRDGLPDLTPSTAKTLNLWRKDEFEAWTLLAATTARSAVRARATLLRVAEGEPIAGLSAEAHRRVRAAYVIHQEVERIETAAYLDGLIDAGFLPNQTQHDVRRFTGTFGPRFTPDENSELSDVARALAVFQTQFDASRGDAVSMRHLMLSEARSLNVPFEGTSLRTTLTGENAIYLIRALLRENLLRHRFPAMTDDVLFLVAFHPELFSIWPQLEAWSIPAHEIDLRLADSYLNAPNVRLGSNDLVGLQLERSPSAVDGPPFTENVKASLVVSRREPYDDEAIRQITTRLHDEFGRLKARFGSTDATLANPSVDIFEHCFVLSWPNRQIQPAALITFYAYLRELFPQADP